MALQLLVVCAQAATGVRVSPADFDGQGLAMKPAPRGDAPASGTDVKNLTTLLTYATIQAAIDAATPGDVLEVQVTSHAASIVTVNKAVTIQGWVSGATITPTADTGTSGDARGWFLVTVSGVSFKKLDFDGSGHSIYQVLRFTAAASGALVEDCDFAHATGLPLNSYDGRGIATQANITVRRCTFTDIRRIGVHLFGTGVTNAQVIECTYTGKGAVDGLDYGVEFGGGAVGTVGNSTINACLGTASDGSGSAGVLITDYYAPGTAGTLTGNFITGNSEAVGVGYLATDASVVIAHGNDFSGNSWGTPTTNPAVVVDASANWWGSNVGATIAAYNGPGVDYTPWLHLSGDTGGAAGFQGNYSILDVDDDSPQVGSVIRIQEGINLVTASTVNVGPGNYPGTVTVTQKITLQGAGDGTNPAVDTILLPASGLNGIQVQAGGTGTADRCIIRNLRVAGGGGGLRIDTVLGYLTLENLTITGTSVQGFEIHNTADVVDLVMTDVDLVNNLASAMRVRGKLNGLTMTNGHIDGNVFGLQSYTGVGEGNNFRNVVVTGTTFNNNASKGMYFEKLSDALFDGIAVVNSGTAGAWAAGVDVNLKYAAYQNLEFRNSTISGCGTGDAVNGVGIAVKARDDGGYAGSPATLTNVDLAGNVLTGCQNGIRFGEPTKNNAGPTVVDVHQNRITGSLGMGLVNASLTTTNATCNWWGNILGPNVLPGNPSPGDGITGAATYAPWWTTPSGPCNGDNSVAANTTGLCISTATPCVTAPMVFTRIDVANARGISVTFQLSSNLALCSTPAASILQGSWLPGTTAYQVLDNGGGSYTVDQAILGLPCGVTTGGTLFTIQVKKAPAALDGSGTITVTAVTARDCNNAPLPGFPGAPGVVPIDYTLPTPIADLAATQVKTGNDADGTTKIRLTFTAPGDASSVEVYRAPYGNYPEYNDAPNAGLAPSAPSYPPGAPWSRTNVTVTTQTDELGPSLPGTSHLEVAGTFGSNNWVDPRTNYAYRLGGTGVGKNNHNIPPGLPTGFPTGTPDPNLASIEYFRLPKGGTITISGSFVTPLTSANFATNAGQFLTVGLVNKPWVDYATLTFGYNSGMFNTPGVGANGNAYLLFFKNGSNVRAAMEDHNSGNVTSPDQRDVASVTTFSIQFQDGLDKTGATVATGGRMRYSLGGGSYGPWDDNSHDFRQLTALQLGTLTVDGGVASADFGAVTAAIRDFWYYVAFSKDGCGNVSAVSNLTGGTLNYHLGDVTNSTPIGFGDNQVVTGDISLLGAHYGATLAANDPFDYLDVGPTSNYSVEALPTTDNKVQFEDLMMFAINYGQVSKVREIPTPAQTDELIVLVPERTAPGSTLAAHLWLRGTGRVQGLSAKLAWNAAVVEPVGIEAGELLRDQDGVALSSEPGTVDVALLGTRPTALAGEGDLATVRFRVIAAGDPGIAIASLDARDSQNRHVEMGTRSGGNDPQANLPRVTALLANVPNPFNPSTKIPFTLAVGGKVELAIFTVDGRKVRSLVNDTRQPGLYEATWNGTDESGTRVSSGAYYVRLVTREGTHSRPVVMLK